MTTTRKPYRAASRPATGLTITMASDVGRVCRPARRIELPWTSTKNWEKKNDEPISANPTTTMAVLDTVNSRCRNNRSGRIGAERRRASTATKAARQDHR